MRPSRYSATRHFRDLKIRDICYEVTNNGKQVYAVVHKVVRLWLPRLGGKCPRGGLFCTLPCYSDGTPMLYFGMWFRRTSGIEYGNWQFEQPADRPRIRLYLDLPKGIFAVSRPKREAA